MPLGERLGATGGQALMTAFAVIVEYARLLVWPARLSPDYSYNQIPLVTSALDGRFLAGVALAAACICGIVVLWRRSPIAAFGLALLAATFSVVSNFVDHDRHHLRRTAHVSAERGALIAAGVGADGLTRNRASAPAHRVRRARRR